jgi:hypothetical protein
MEAILNVRFTDPAAALHVNVQSDSIESLFAMSTSRVPGAPEPPVASAPRQTRSAEPSGSAPGRRTKKRPFEESTMRRRIPAKVVERVSPPPASARGASGAQSSTPSRAPARHQPSHPVRHAREEPLFLPDSQMSAADREALHASGLGDMDADEFNAMLEDDGEEVGINLHTPDAPGPSVPPSMPPSLTLDLDLNEEQGHGQDVNRFEDDIESEMDPTQSDESGKVCRPTYPLLYLHQNIFLLIVHVFTGLHGRRSDRCSMTDAHPCTLYKLRHSLFPNAETSGIQPSPFRIKPTLLLSWLKLQLTYNDCRQLVRTFRVLDLSTSVGFSHNLSAINTPVHSRMTIQHDTRKEGYDNIQCPWMRCELRREKGGLGFGHGHGRSQQMRVTIFERQLFVDDMTRHDTTRLVPFLLHLLLYLFSQVESGSLVSNAPHSLGHAWTLPFLKHSDWPIEDSSCACARSPQFVIVFPSVPIGNRRVWNMKYGDTWGD